MRNEHCSGDDCDTPRDALDNCGCACVRCEGLRKEIAAKGKLAEIRERIEKPAPPPTPAMPSEGHSPECTSEQVRSILISEKELHIALCLTCYRVLHACSDPADHKPPQVYRCSHPRCHWRIEVVCADARKYSHTEGPPYCRCGAMMVEVKKGT